MSSKRKMWITIASLVVVVVAMVGVTIGVLAASTATVTSNINVRYVAQEVAVICSADYKVGGISAYGSEGTAVNMTVNGAANGSTTVEFDGSETTATGTLSPTATIDLTKTNHTVVFRYTFQNTGSGTITATLTPGITTAENVTYSYSKDDSTWVASGSAAAADYTFTIAESATAYYYVKVSITNVALNASFAATPSWALAYTAPSA